MSTSTAFDYLHERVRQWVWEQRWSELRDVQEEAIPLILRGDTDLLLSAATAMGKTEAAFLPILTRLRETRDEGAQAPGIETLYISPLKALINDQFGRLELLCEQLEIPVHRWHGDVGAGRKHALLKNPTGILLITPESLEALFVHRGAAVLKTVFGRLRYVVVDEVHTFIGTERGRQLQSLLHRIENLTTPARMVPRIGLSATLSDLGIGAAFLRPNAPTHVFAVVSHADGQEIRAQIRGYRDTEPPLPNTAGEEDEEFNAADEAIADHLLQLRTGHHLIFTNRRADVEAITDRLVRRCQEQNLPVTFYPHHGSLSKEIREDTEARLRDSEQNAAAVCTSTLEMGIDIGAMETIAQIGVPPSVASLRQRTGRSGRRGSPCKIRLYIKEADITPTTALPDLLRLQTVQAAVMLQLMVRGWCEPPREQTYHFSTLVQQTLSVLAQQGGGASAVSLYRLFGSGPFATVDKAMFIEFLRALHSTNTLEQMADGTLIPAKIGEQLLAHYTFYTAFATPEEYRLIAPGGKLLGTLPVEVPLPPGTYLIYAGRRWCIEAVDDTARVIDVVPARGGRPPLFSGTGSFVDGTIRAAMLAFYKSEEIPPFLDATARTFVQEGRDYFHRSLLATERIIERGADTRVFLWSGDDILQTLRLELLRRGIPSESEEVCLRIENRAPKEVRELLRKIANSPPIDAVTLAKTVPNTRIEKHDRLLSEDLCAREYAARYLRPEATVAHLRHIL
jgi:ATP-dependent Lhr-like helicase